jgi:drug/metabolite transporter (DMT)-like permease
MSLIHTILVVCAVSAVAVADVFLKKTQALGSMSKALVSPWMLAAIILYVCQIFFFTYLFMSGAKLTYIGIVQTVLYALIVFLAGIFMFGETLTVTHIIGIVLAIIGVVLLNL